MAILSTTRSSSFDNLKKYIDGSFYNKLEETVRQTC